MHDPPACGKPKSHACHPMGLLNALSHNAIPGYLKYTILCVSVNLIVEGLFKQPYRILAGLQSYWAAICDEAHVAATILILRGEAVNRRA